MAKTSAARIRPENRSAEALAPPLPVPRQENSQSTLSTLGDVTIAATNSSGRDSVAAQTIGWFSITGFFFLMYFATCFVTLFTVRLDRWVFTLLTPLAPVLVATGAFWARQRSKLRVRNEGCKSAMWRNALGSLSHEASSGTNALRANLMGFRLAHPEPSQSDLLNAIEHTTARIEKALQKANGLLASQSKVN